MAKASTTSTDTTRAIIYARVSSDRAGGRSVEEQIAECRAVCDRNGWTVADVLDDNDRSASRYATKTRPKYAELLDRLRPGDDMLRPGDVVVMWEASRATRDQAQYVELRSLLAERGVLWSYSGKVYDLDDGGDRFSTGLDILMQEKSAEETRDRSRRAQRANLAAGRPHGRPPYGYKIVRDPETGKPVSREPDPARAKLITEAARRVLDGHSLGSVVRWIETKDPLGWDAAKLRRLLLNPALAGYRTHKGAIHGPGTWKPILTPEQHDDLIALFAARQTGPRGMPVKHLLTGIAQCDECGAGMVRRKSGKRAGGEDGIVYACPSQHVGRNMDDVNAAVSDVIESMLTNTVALAAMATPRPEPDSTATARLAELRERLAAIEEQLIDGTMTASTGARVTTRLGEQIAELETAIKPVYTDPVVAEVATAPDPVALFHALPVAQRREFIRATITITVERIGKGRWHDRRAGIRVDPRRNP